MSYVFQEFPKWKYHAEYEARIIHSKVEEEALGREWANSPAEITKSQAPKVTEMKSATKRIKKS